MPKSLRAADPSITSIFPDIPPVKKLTVVESDIADIDFWVWLRSLQGLVNRIEPRMYVLRANSVPELHWLKVYREKYGIPEETGVTPDEALERFKGCVSGYVIYDNKNLIQTQNIAITLCGLEGYLPVSPENEDYMLRHGIKKVGDLRGLFSDDWAAAEWAVDNLWPRCNKRMVANMCIHRPSWMASSNELVDYVVYNRVFTLDLPRSRIFRRALDLSRRLMETAEAPGVLLCWHCIWDQEKEYIAEAAERGFFALCSTGAPNMTIQGGVGDPQKSFVQPLPPAGECIAEPDKTYVCLYNSDGDAPWAMHNLHSLNWLDPDRGSFPFGWGFLPLITKMMPACLEYYHETRLPNDCFWGPSSGAGYTYSWLWPDDLADIYLRESRRLLDQSGQNGCNMVNWFLRDWWREVEDTAAVTREQELLSSGPGLVCGLGGSPYAASYPCGRIPKLHSVHIANVGNDNIGDIVRFTRECPTRPAFMFLFAQIAPGIFKQLNGEMEELAKHPDIKLLSMDAFFLTLQDAVKKGLIKDELYEKTDALAETWLKAPGRHRLPLYEHLTEELLETALAAPEERRLRLSESGYTQLVSGEIEGIAPDRKSFAAYFPMRRGLCDAEDADMLFYSVFTVAWGVLRSALESNGIYANNRFKTLEDFERICAGIIDPAPFKELFSAWDNWESETPAIERSVEWARASYEAAKKLNALWGDSGEFTGWPPKTI